MLTYHPADQRGHTDIGWLDSHHSFSFASWYDPERKGFRALRVINDDRVQARTGFGTHPHDNMEIITWVLDGTLSHADSMGHKRQLLTGEAQVMSAGSGLTHSEMNDSDSEVHFLQIWIIPATRGGAPRYDQRQFPVREQPNRWHRIADGQEREGALPIKRDASVSVAVIEAGEELEATLAAGRHGWLQVATGAVQVGDQQLVAGDALSLSAADDVSLTIRAGDEAQILFFDLD